MNRNHKRGACKSEGVLWLIGGAALGLILAGVSGCERSRDQSVISSPATKPRPITVKPGSGGSSAVVVESVPRSESEPHAKAAPRVKPPAAAPTGTEMRTEGDAPRAPLTPSSAVQESPTLVPESAGTGQTSAASELVEPTRSEVFLKAAPEKKPSSRNEDVSTPRPPPAPIQGPPISLSPNIDG